ncbi:MAG TPA: hypothetical protein PK014_13580 [Thermoanaerobaculia bacterium]|nr:hypothetical protein [Thermoanaerobaculia bacterium]HUM28505.1 hypothetical protein [Thermoanaerobaculia bacterium]HXK66887.1 hypothetical protein [Thermoanaerobaculia bacterium]
MSKWIIGLLGILLTISCASTDISSIKNPEIKSKKYSKIIIFCPFSDIESRRASESVFIEQLAYSQVKGVSSMVILPPLREYSVDEVEQRIKETKADGILMLNLIDSFSEERFVEPTSTTTLVRGKSVTFKTTQTGGYYISLPRLKYEIKLLDADTRDVAWMATSLTEGSRHASLETMMRSLAKEAVSLMKSDRVI